MNQAKAMQIDPIKIRKDFPILNQKVNNYPLVYFDNAATTQKPQIVINAINDYYSTINSNVHRGVHHLSQLATDAFEEGRTKVADHINAAHSHEVIFTKGVSESMNLLAFCIGQKHIQEGDEILISDLEHHSNIVPWQMLCERNGAILKHIPFNDKGELDLKAFKELLSSKTKVLSINHISNALGTVNPIKSMIAKAHEYGALCIIDGAQSGAHMKVDVQDLDADFYALSGHKMFGPTGFGMLYGKEALWNNLPPYQGGGEMIASVSFEKTTYAGLPHKFEAGTPNIAGGVAIGKAIDYINSIGLEAIGDYENELLEYGHKRLSEIEGIRFIGEATEKASVISFLVGDIHPYDIGVILDKLGVAVRTGHHCTQPIMDILNIPGTIRASFSFYNTFDEIDRMIEAIKKAQQMLS